jgi:micrococcal nuclease
MRHARRRLVPTLAVWIAGSASVSPAYAQDGRCVVARVIDGDTLECESGERVRLTLIDSPEMIQGPLGSLARQALLELAPPGTDLGVELDVAERDRYRRVLAYLYLPDGTMVNEEMVRRGYATTMVVPPNVRYVERIRRAAQLARDEGVGLWSAEPTEAEPASGCSEAYPDHCIPPPPPDLDCSDVPYKRFRVLYPDPHRFDGNGDGVGCEGPPGLPD